MFFIEKWTARRMLVSSQATAIKMQILPARHAKDERNLYVHTFSWLFPNVCACPANRWNPLEFSLLNRRASSPWFRYPDRYYWACLWDWDRNAIWADWPNFYINLSAALRESMKTMVHLLARVAWIEIGMREPGWCFLPLPSCYFSDTIPYCLLYKVMLFIQLLNR